MSSEIVEQICLLPVVFAGSGKSTVQLIEQSGYLQSPKSLSVEAVVTFLRQKPELIDEWLRWSGDQRIPSGWAFDQLNGQYRLWDYPNGERLTFVDRFEACAEFVVRYISSVTKGLSA